jgi:hypothetical protein
VRARRALEVAEAEPEHDRPADAPCRAEAPGDPVDDPHECRVDGLGRVAPTSERPLRADRAASPSGLDAPEVAVVCERAELTACRPPEHRHERRLGERSELADRAHVPRLQPARRGRPDTPDELDRQRMQELELAVRRDDDQAVRLCDPARHLGEELRPGDADRDG